MTANPAVTTPGVPTVIGPSNTTYAPGTGLAAMRGGSAAGMSGMPYLPMMGGGGAMGAEGDDLERTTFISEDRSSWNTGHDVTDPVIG
jgi:hypothetical protein